MVQVHSLQSRSTLFLLLCACVSTIAQTVVNGQIFTNGLAIVDAPAIDSTMHAGSPLNLAIDVSGDGKLNNWEASSTPGSTLETRYDSLEVYLVSSDTSTNLTVSSGPGLLTQETGSTVKHSNWQIPSCIKAGKYNMTVYESAHINGQAYFSITALPIEVQNSSPGGACTEGTNELQQQPQSSSPPPTNPWTGGTIGQPTQTSSGFVTIRTPMWLSAYSASFLTVTIGLSGILWPSGYSPVGQPSPGMGGSTVTITVQPPVETATVVIVSPEIIPVTTTVSGKQIIQTSTTTAFSTVTTMVATANNDGAFFPVSSGNPQLSKPYIAGIVVAWNAILLALAVSSL